MSETEKNIWASETFLKLLFKKYFSDNEHVKKYSWGAITMWNNFEIITENFPRAEIKLFQTESDESWNNFAIILFHM